MKQLIWLILILIISNSKLTNAQQKSVEDIYPKVIGGLRFEYSQLNLGNVKNTSIRHDTIKIFNSSEIHINISFINLPAYISCKVVPEYLKANEAGLILVDYDARKRNDFGYVCDMLKLMTNDNIQPEKTINVSAMIVEDFDKMSQQEKDNAPKINFNSTNCNYATVNEGSKVQCNFIFVNSGKNNLIIRKIKASCGCVATSIDKSILQNGESGKIMTTFNTNGRNGNQKKTVTVICNDPNNSIINLVIEGNVIASSNAQNNSNPNNQNTTSNNLSSQDALELGTAIVVAGAIIKGVADIVSSGNSSPSSGGENYSSSSSNNSQSNCNIVLDQWDDKNQKATFNINSHIYKYCWSYSESIKRYSITDCWGGTSGYWDADDNEIYFTTSLFTKDGTASSLQSAIEFFLKHEHCK